jgi:hypothetical protein
MAEIDIAALLIRDSGNSFIAGLCSRRGQTLGGLHLDKNSRREQCTDEAGANT